jgi:hypothetical protein
VWAGDATCAFDSAGHHHADDDFGCGACQDRHCPAADD